MQRVLVTGGTGFIGRNMVERLAERDDVQITATHFSRPPVDLPGVTWQWIDLTEGKAVRDLLGQGFDVVIHAAAATSGAADIVARPHIHIADSAVMTSHLMGAAHEHNVGRFILFSCSIMYPDSSRPLTEDEVDLEAIFPPYHGGAWNKLYFENMARFYAGLGRSRYTAIRHSNIYGPHDKFDLQRSHVFGASLTKVMTATDHVTVWGSGEEGRDLLHVDDLLDFVEAALAQQQTPFELVNVGAGKVVTIRELVALMVRLSGRDISIEHDLSKPTLPITIRLDCGRAERLFGWKPKIPLEDGIRRTMDWWLRARGV
ncbi:GDP-L-fucose synthase [Magnetospira thiophila]